ncbi:hypothetical protein BDV97DRAFT_391850 [Delphinella strobiligena]|nr:hypothetical protein BDV97DRAFT_391850 [Delphinella strobiligena]
MSLLPLNYEGRRDGYPGLAKVMGPHDNLALYRKFADLNARNLLPISEGNRAGIIFSKRGEEDTWFRGSWLSSAGEDEALLQQAETNKLEKAQKQDLEVLQDWLRRPEGGDNFLRSFEDRPWSENTNDLVALGGMGSDIDAVTKWTVSRAIPWLDQHGMHRLKTPFAEHKSVGLVEYRNTSILKTMRAISVVISSSIPALAVLVLYYIDSLYDRHRDFMLDHDRSKAIIMQERLSDSTKKVKRKQGHDGHRILGLEKPRYMERGLVPDQ